MPIREKVVFTGHDAAQLSGLLEKPDMSPLATVLMAHCFTCGKDIAAASRIARALVKRGFAVMRFDFTGLGNSDGDFANTNFSSNVQDLVKAAEFLRGEGLAPSVLIGHSLGGTAVLNAVSDIPEALGVVTIGSPADAQHIVHHFACDIDVINKEGEAEVDLAGRKFTIKKQFLEDISESSSKKIQSVKQDVLVMHSPTDQTVSINEAERIYKAAPHPKSFISLDQADHLLTRSTDAEYVANIISSWSSRFLKSEESNKPDVRKGELRVEEHDHRFALNVSSDSHQWLADEPVAYGGNNTGPDPYEHLLASLGACSAMTVRMYAERKKWPLDDVIITLRHERTHATDCEDCEASGKQLDVLERDVEFVGDLSDEQRTRLLEIADKCPVHKTLTGQIDIRSSLV